MSVNDDSQQISSLLHDDEEIDLSYSDSQLEYIVDSNSTSYTTQITFDCLPLTSKWCDLHNAYVTIPVSITPSAGSFSAAPVVAFKASILSLIRGVNITTGSGQTIFQESENFFINNLRLYLEQSNDFFISNKDHLQLGIDKPLPGALSTLTSSANLINPRTAMFTAAVSATANSLNGNFNAGFTDRNNALLTSTVAAGGAYGTGSITTILYLPLKYFCSFIDQLSFPIINTRLQINILLNTTASGSPFIPVCTGTTLAGAVENTTNGVTTAIGYAGNQQCRLYYHNVKFSPQQAVMINKRLQQGFTKKISYTQTDVTQTYTNIASTSGFSHVVASSVISPQRVWAMCYPTGQLNTKNWPSPVTTGLFGLTNLNIQLNGTNYFTNAYNSTLELWDALSAQFPPSQAGQDTSSLLSYNDFINTYRIHCLDISRNKDRLRDPNAPVTLIVTGAPLSATAIDIVYLIEKTMKCVITFGASDVQVTVGATAF